MRTMRNRDGFAMPMAVLLIGFMTAAVVAAFTRIEAEGRTIDDQATEVEAFAIAQAGLERAMVAAGNTTPGSTTYAVTGGTATVQRYLVRAAANARDTSIWLFRSTGRTTARPARPATSRDVAQWVYRAGGTMQVLSSWTSLSGLRKAGVSGDMTGVDECSQATTLAGVAVPTGTFAGHDDAITGNPPISEMGTQAQMASQIKIDWVNIAKPSAPAINPDFIYCPGGYGYDAAWGSCNGWPTSAMFADTSFWPVIVINGTSALPSDGRGTLIVTGDLTFGGGDQWDGIILVGGRIVDNGSGDISGSVVSGLNVLKGEVVGESSRANGTKDYSYNSCEVARAASQFSRLTPMRNAWMDNWPAWQ